MGKVLVFVLGAILANLPGTSARAADVQNAAAIRHQRLASLCRLWGKVRYLHPSLAYQEIDWDQALIRALPRVADAKTAGDYATAVQDMLDALKDPATHVIRPAGQSADKKPSAKPKPQKPPQLSTWLADGVLAISLTEYAPIASLFQLNVRQTLQKEIGKARAVVIDLRTSGGMGYYAAYGLGLIQDRLVSRKLAAPAQRYLVHSGFRPQEGTTSGGYFSAFQSEVPQTWQPAPDQKPRRVVFLVNVHSELPGLALALQKAGDGFVVAQGKLPEGMGTKSATVALGEGIFARVRMSELVGPRGLVRVRADAEVPADGDLGPKGPAFQKALELVRGTGKPKKQEPAVATPLPLGTWRPDRQYRNMVYPNREYRLLALFRFWTIIHYFYPYQHLIGDWDAVLTEFLPRFEKAKNARAYALAVAELATHVPDGHTSVSGSAELSRYFGAAWPPIALRLVEGVPVVVGLGQDREVKEAGVRVGDVLLSVDSEPVKQRMRRYGKYLAASNPGWHHQMILYRLLGGPDGSTATLEVRTRDKQVKTIRLKRGSAFITEPRPAGEVYRILADRIGYVDLARLTVAQVDAMFEHLKGTRAIIFDLRCYPRGTAWSLAPRLNVKGARYAASFYRQLVTPETEDASSSRFTFLQPIATSPLWKYRGQVVTLIDERAISQAEHTGLFLEAACGTTFIGSPTAGANGDVTNFYLPGGLMVRFTGHDVRHADGRQLQRVGLAPQVAVKPTIAGIRAGKDEVLERALRYIREEK